MKHFISGEEITIEWEQGQWLESEGRHHMYVVTGDGSDGKHYIGTGKYFAGELEDVEDVDLN